MVSSKLLSEVAIAFVEGEHFHAQVGVALKAMGECLHLSRAYLFLDGADRFAHAHGYEWCDDGVPSVRESLESLSPSTFHAIKQRLQEQARVLTSDLGSLPDLAQQWLASHGIRTLLLYPIIMSREIAGFAAFEDCVRTRVWSNEVLDLLGTASEIVSAFCERKIRSEQVRASEENFRRFFDSIEDLIVIADMEGQILFTNPAVEIKLGFAPFELNQMAITDLSSCDLTGKTTLALEAMLRQETVLAPLLFCHKSGRHLMVEARVWFGQWNEQDCLFCIAKDLTQEQEALQKFTKIFENNPALIAILSYDENRFTDVNASFLETLGYRREEVIGKTSTELGLFLDDTCHPKVAAELKRLGGLKNVEMKIRHKNGSFIDGLFFGTVLESVGEKYLLTFMVDISDQIALRDRLASQRKRLRNIIDGARMGTWEWNIETDEVVLNERWAEMLGYQLSELGSRNMAALKRYVHPEDLPKSDELIRQHFAGLIERYDVEMRMQHKNRHWVWVHVRGRVIERDADDKPLMMFGTQTDISERKALEERIIQISIRDSLTGVYNRRYVFERLDEIFAEYVRRGRNFSIAIMDIDHFKRVNDRYGHQAGDFILRQFAEIVDASIRAYDILGRYGGEEFILVSVNSNANDTVALIERIMATIRERVFVYHGSEICFRFSCGMADSSEFPADALSIEKMVELADQRLYRAKETGRDRLMSPLFCA